ncbi:GNAT family N-acetyltransferase [Paractinoplanes rhizophilus]|uniref:GNAT family N-acetyltransferase n=1 Tax=Paractinoplanes rhizophilus TaxID=1416877 RepID=A0ABW2HLU8_9ACTN
MNLSMGRLDDPADAYEIYRVCAERDTPDIPPLSLESFVARLANPFPGADNEHYLAWLDGRAVGYLSIELPLLDNLDNANVDLTVLPSWRRRGAGRALLDLAVRRVRELGRKHVIAPAMSRHPDGALFATAVDAKPALEEVRSRLDLGTVDQARHAVLLADAWEHAAGYRLILWTGVAPDEIIDDVAYLDGRLNADAPTGELAWEPEKVDAAKVREGELRAARRGRSSYHAGALHGDRLVAWTRIAGDATDPAHAWQNITLVDPEHRGHRLGMLVKLANLAHVRELRPGLEAIDTLNAATNEHMLRINRALGFRALDSVTFWQLTV